MAEIIGAVMPKSLADLEEHVAKIADSVSFIQIDVMDGSFVRSKSWPYIRQDDYFEEIMTGERGLPFWDSVDYEADLMVTDQFAAADHFVAAGAKRIIFHIEALLALKGETTESLVAKVASYKNDFTEVALAINVDTPLSLVEPFLKDISCLQCMGIKRIGYQGEPFDESVLQKIKDIHSLAPELTIAVDGGINEETIEEIIEAGATRLVCGSAIFHEDNPIEAYRHLGALAAHALHKN